VTLLPRQLCICDDRYSKHYARANWANPISLRQAAPTSERADHPKTAQMDRASRLAVGRRRGDLEPSRATWLRRLSALAVHRGSVDRGNRQGNGHPSKPTWRGSAGFASSVRGARAWSRSGKPQCSSRASSAGRCDEACCRSGIAWNAIRRPVWQRLRRPCPISAATQPAASPRQAGAPIDLHNLAWLGVAFRSWTMAQ
jgi:hypothetical protein